MAEMPNADLTERLCQHSAEVVLADDSLRPIVKQAR